MQNQTSKLELNIDHQDKISKINHDKVLKFYLHATPAEICQLIFLISDKITIPIKKDGYVDMQELDKEIPVVMNGPYFQINTEELYKDNK